MPQNRYHRPEGLNSSSLGISLAITGGMIAGLIFAAPRITPRPGETHLQTTNVPVPPPPPPDPTPLPKTRTPQIQPAAPTPRMQPSPSPQPIITIAPVPIGTILDVPGPGPLPSASPTAEPTAPPPPVLVDAQVDPRYVAALQPAYPPEERRAEREGRVVVRVLVGVDGRVKQVERRTADSDAFYRETERQALTKWRFRPATRDGIPVEAWRVMAIRFVLRDG